jgi:RNA polymerase sigma-B factor
MSRSSLQERRLARRNRCVQDHLQLVEQLARHYAVRSQEPLQDLRQVGALGLIRAAERFRPDQAVPFAAFARPHIRGAILHHLRDLVPLIRVSRRLQERRLLLERYKRGVWQREGREPTPLEQRMGLGLSEGQWHDLQALPRLTPLSPAAADHLRLGVDDLQDRQESCSPCALAALAELSLKERHVVEQVILEGKSLRAVAEAMGSSATTAHRLLHQGLKNLRKALSPGAPAHPASVAPAC